MWISKEVVAIVTSTGSLALMDVASILKGENFEKSLIAKHTVMNDPRFICVTGWNAKISGKMKFMCSLSIHNFCRNQRIPWSASFEEKEKRTAIEQRSKSRR